MAIRIMTLNFGVQDLIQTPILLFLEVVSVRIADSKVPCRGFRGRNKTKAFSRTKSNVNIRNAS
jgi:hypothetical protein